MQVFVVRPFGTKKVLKKMDSPNEDPQVIAFDFDRIEQELIQPALNGLQLTGGTTGKIFESGEIREDMFSLLLLADVVIADISIHNANVFYELGIRHALKNKTTVLIKCPGFDETPFDILGFRYVTYDKDAPATSIPALISSLQDSQLSERKDSPVFTAMPHLAMQDTEKFFIVPGDFLEETGIAIQAKEPGKLALLASEAASFAWKIPAQRIIGEALVNMEAYDYARNVWEQIKMRYPQDKQANMNLATIYQRLSEQELASNPTASQLLLAKSDISVNNLFEFHASAHEDLSAFYALKGRNLKSRWVNDVKCCLPEKMSESALQSVFLEAAFQQYEKGYYENLNHFHCGINALGFLTIIISLATRHPDIWNQAFETEEGAMKKLEEYKCQHDQMAVCLRLAVCIAKDKMSVEEEASSWLNFTEADLACISNSKVGRVNLLYRKALQSANQLQKETALRQLRMFALLNIMPENVTAAMSAFTSTEITARPITHYILFTGHMLDRPGTTEPRFPPGKEKPVREKIKEAILQEIKVNGANITGIAGGACGADIIFHEVCQEMEIPSKLFLALPREQFITTSVAFAGPSWIERFNRLFLSLPVSVLANSTALPKWLGKKTGYNIWKRNNLWELHAALTNGGLHMTLVALWNGKGGDGLGGTEHMVNEAVLKGAKTIIIDLDQVSEQ